MPGQRCLQGRVDPLDHDQQPLRLLQRTSGAVLQTGKAFIDKPRTSEILGRHPLYQLSPPYPWHIGLTLYDKEGLIGWL
jgi:hypothetical protein